MRVQVLDVVRGEDGIDRAGSNFRHIGHGAGDVRRDGGIDVQPDFAPSVGVEAAGGLCLALGAAADVEDFHLTRKSPPHEGWAFRVAPRPS